MSSTCVNLQRVIQLGLLPWRENTFYTMRKRGVWKWVVRCGGRLAVDVDALDRFMKETGPHWAYALKCTNSIQRLREAAES